MPRTQDRPIRIAIAGGSRGIGAALAQGLARPGCRIALAGRDAAALASRARSLRQHGAEVTIQVGDLARPGAAALWLDGLFGAEPPDLVIIAMGLFGGRPAPGAAEPEAVARRLVTVNLSGAIALSEAAVRRMRPTGRGTVLLISSLAARDPQPDAAAYSASKAGVSSYARALREDLAGSGLRVLLVEPGHVATRQTDQHRGALPMLLSAEEAARRILRGLDRGATRLAFPRRAVLALALLNSLPWRWRARLMRDQRFSVDNAPVEAGDAPATGGPAR